MYTYPKNVLSIYQLKQKLLDAGMNITNHQEADDALLSIGYYRLRGYCFHLYDRNTCQYRKGTTFSGILRLYQFDTELSQLIFSYIKTIEIALRARLVESLQIHNDPLVLHDPSIFDNKEKYWQNQGAISSEIARAYDVFIRHNFNNYEGAIPFWATVEIMSFGTLSKIIKLLKTGRNSSFSILANHYSYRSANGNTVKPSKDMLSSWLQAVTIMRNICAHNSRIYNRTINTRPQLPAADMGLSHPQFNGLYEILLAMKYLRPSDSSWRSFVDNLNALLSEYNGIFDFDNMNFPQDWAVHFIV